MSKRLFWRVHWPDLPPFSARNAWSRQWQTYGTDEERVQRGYSAMPTAYDLVRYFAGRRPIRDQDPIVVFEGTIVGVGPDGEDLVIPSRVVGWIRGKDLDEGILEHEDEPQVLQRLLARLGRKRRLR